MKKHYAMLVALVLTLGVVISTTMVSNFLVGIFFDEEIEKSRFNEVEIGIKQFSSKNVCVIRFEQLLVNRLYWCRMKFVRWNYTALTHGGQPLLSDTSSYSFLANNVIIEYSFNTTHIYDAYASIKLYVEYNDDWLLVKAVSHML
ncbi:MAG: hypothetical protein ACFE9L_18905 [Candidatus Hodarchaeota archaeon]